MSDAQPRSGRAGAEELVVVIDVVCRELPGSHCAAWPDDPGLRPIWLGVQKGRAGEEWVPGDLDEVLFRPSFRVRRGTHGTPNFLGPYAQGKRDDRFFYLVWAADTADGRREMFRRLKVRLGHLSWPTLEAAAAGEARVAVLLDMTDAHGGPLCATPPSSKIEWRVEKGAMQVC
jgi:hypothetical protein